MSSNRVPANQNPRVHSTHLRQLRSPWTSIITVLVLVLGLGGCALNSTGLPGGLPVPPGGGKLTISRSTLMPGITGRSYTIWIPTSGGTGTLAPGGCTLIAGSLPAGLSVARSDDLPTTTALTFCKITGTITTAGPATVSFTLEVADTATPANTASQAFSIVVRPEFAVTTATPFLNGVIGRTYGNAPQAPQPVATSASATVGNSPLTTCAFTIAGNPGFNLAPAPTGGNTCPLSSGATALTASGLFSVSLAATDSDLMDTFAGQTTKIVVPRNTINSAALGLTVNAALGVTLTQATNATPLTTLLNAVQGRTYGTIGGTPTYAATGGLTTTGNYNWCVSAGALPAGFTTGPVAVSTNCAAPTAIATATSVTVTSAAAGAAGGPTAFTLLAGDTGNAAVPGATAAATVGLVSNFAATNLTINAPLALAVNLANPLPDAVIGRTYGGAGFTSIIYTASFGEGAYSFTAPPSAGAPAAGVFPAPMACVSAPPNLTCSSAAITGTAGPYTNAPASVDDAGNAAVPGSAAAAATATQTRTLNVLPALSFASVNYANPLPAAVNGRSWGTGVGFTPLVYTAQDGLGGYSFAISGTTFPTGIACATSGATFTCDTSIAGTVTGAPNPYNGILVNANDTANATTPNAQASATQPPAISRDLLVNADINLASVAPDPGNATTSTAVIGRTYGIAPQSPPLYTFAGGLVGAGYAITTPAIPAWMTCTPGVTTLSCDSGVTTVAAGASTLTVNVLDTANAATPARSAAFVDTRVITVNPDLSFTSVTPDPGNAATSTAVITRTYGKAPQSPPVYTVSGGLGSNSFTTSAIPAWMTCTPAATTLTCDSGATTVAAGPSTLTVNVVDIANATSPAKTPALTDTRVITVVADLSLVSVVPDPGNAATSTAVIGRTYGIAPQSPPLYTFTGGLVGAGYTITTPAIPAWMTCTPAATTLTCDSGATTVAAGPSTLTVNVVDTANSTTPAKSPVLADTRVITVNTALSVALQTVPASPDPTLPAGHAVVGRTYGSPSVPAAPAKANVVYEVSGGLPAYTITPSGTLTTATNIVCVSGATTSTCNSGGLGVTNTGGANPSLTITATDTANSTTPAAPVAATKTDLWTVNPAITFSLAPGATGVVPNGAIPDGVVGRTYGTPLADLVFTASGGLGNTAGIGLTGTQTGTLIANNIVCTPATPQVGASVTVTCNSTAGGGAVTAPAGAGRTLVMTFGDAGNSTTPLGSTSTDSAGYTNYSNTIATVLSVALQTVPASPDPTTPAGQAVVGRTYGAPAKTNVVYEVSGGLPAYSIIPSGTLTTATNIVCVSGATTSTCNSGGANVSNTGVPDGVNPSLTITATDTANISTPAAAVPATKTDVWTVNPAITFSLVPGATGLVPNGAIPDGVVGRQYGQPLGANNLVFTGGGGLGSAAGFGLTGTATGTFVTDSGLICAPATPQVGATATVTCNSGGGVSTLGGTAGLKTLVMTFSDAGNSTTPGNPTGATSTDTAGYTNYSNTMAAALAIALQAGSPDPANVNAQAVVGRTYGAAPEAPVVYEASGGLPGYAFSPSGPLVGPPANSNICLVPVTTATTLACNSGGVGATGSTADLTVTVSDTANATTPSGSQSLLKTYTIDPALTLTVAPDPDSASSAAVEGRLYGAPAGGAFLSPTYTAAGGIPPYNFAKASNTLEANTNIVCTVAATTTTCESGVAVTSANPTPTTETLAVTVTDNANLTTPASAAPVTPTTPTSTFTIKAPLVISTASLPNGLVNHTYVPAGPGVTLQSTGGLGGNTWVPGGSTVGLCSPTATTVFPSGLTLVPSSGLLFGVPDTISAAASDYTFEVCVFDTANATTPSGIPAALPTYTINVLDTLAYAAGSGNDTVGKFNTTSNASPATSIALTGSDQPFGVAVTPDGRKVYVTAFGADAVRVIDTITGLVTSVTPNLGSCTGPQGIAIGSPGGLPTAFVACSNGEVAVIDAATDTFVGSGGFGSGGAFYGVALTPDESLVYVTDETFDEIVVLDAISVVEIFGSPFAAGVTAPHGIIISADGNRVYIAGSLSDDVIVLDVATNSTVVAGPISTGLGSGPEALAVTPDTLGAHVYVTLTGTDEFVVIDDTLATPAVAPSRSIDPTAGVGAVRSLGVVTITTTAAHGFAPLQKVIVAGVNDTSFNGAFVIVLVPTATTFTYAQVAADATSEGGTVGPVETLTLASSPWGVTIPPLLTVPASGVRVYIAQFSGNNVAIRNDETTTPFGVNGASPIALTPPATPNPKGIAHIPVPR